MSVTWQTSQQPFPGGMRIGAPSTSSSDYGSWFQPRTPLAFPTPPAGQITQRRNPTRKLGALTITDSVGAPNADSNGTQNNPIGNHPEVLDQSGRVNSFLSKVTQEGRVPRSPRTPDLLDLPGRIVRAPRTRHMTPRNSPDAAKYTDMSHESSFQPTVNSVNQITSPRYVLEQSNTAPDSSPRIHGELTSQGNPFTLQRANTIMAPYQSSQINNPQRPLQPIGPPYIIPKFPLDRSNTMLNIQSQSSNNLQEPTAETAMRPTLQRSSTTLDGSKFNPSGVPEQIDNRVSWNFRRIPSFYGSLPGTQSCIARRPFEPFQPSEEKSSPTSKYMFSNLPDSNAIKNSELDLADPAGLKPRIPMYWLYGSRGRPGLREEPTWAPANSPRDYQPAPLLGQVSNGIGESSSHLPQEVQNHISESDFLTTNINRRDAYRSNYSSYTDQRTQSEPDKSEFAKDVPAAVDTASLPDEPKFKSILKKNSTYGTMPASKPATFPMRTGPGNQLRNLSMNKKNGSKRVTFAM